LAAATAMMVCCEIAPVGASGTLKPIGSAGHPIQIRDHRVNVVINNGFAMTEVLQTFFNPNDRDLEAIYSFPLPKSASLSEVTIYIGEREIVGEVVERDRARRAYEEERDRGRESGLAEKNGFQDFRFHVSPVRANDSTRIRFVYYQPLEIDTGIGRYLYPVEEGGTDDAAASFWLRNTRVEGSLSVHVDLKSAAPIADVRVPGFESETDVVLVEEGRYKVTLERTQAELNEDFVLYYRLADDLPGRVEVVPYRAAADRPGTFMMVVTPGIDLKPITGGADYLFILDVSGSMAGKLATLARGVSRAIGEMKPEDRYRLIAFSTNASELTRGWVNATPANVEKASRQLDSLQANGSTNLYDGIALGLKNLDDDRATALILVTDAVTNTGVVEPRKFHELMKQYDVRMFGFVLGNNANWPLMRTIAEASGGFATGVSNADDILGQLLLAKSKVTHEVLHDASVKVRGVKTHDVTGEFPGKIHRGQQLVLFGRYEKGGRAEVELKARLTGEDRTYRTAFDFPEIDGDNPELERLWALAKIEEIEAAESIGAMDASETRDAIGDLGVAYQLVTDRTSMVVMTDEAFAERGIERRNQARTAIERQAQSARAVLPARDYRVDRSAPAFDRPAPRVGGGGGGALDPITGGIALTLAGLAAAARRRRRDESETERS
jgi:Ca-activated chloride channel family protein